MTTKHILTLFFLFFVIIPRVVVVSKPIQNLPRTRFIVSLSTWSRAFIR